MVERFSYLDQDAWADLDGSRSLTTRRLFGDGIDQPLARLESGTTSFYLTDRLGSVREIAGGTDGSLVYEATYGGFGDVETEVNPSNGDRYLFTGREREIAFNWYYYRARYYDPVTGRFTGEDTIGFAGGDANLYRYVGNGPTNATDPSGRQRVVRSTCPPGRGYRGCGFPQGVLPGVMGTRGNLLRYRPPYREIHEDALQRAFTLIQEEVYSKPQVRWKQVPAISARGTFFPPVYQKVIEYPPLKPFEAYYSRAYREAFKHRMGYDPVPETEKSESLERAQTVLDILGLFPVIGDVCDVISGAISIAQGDYLGAAISLLSIVPLAGTVAGASQPVQPGPGYFHGQAGEAGIKLLAAADKLDDRIEMAKKIIGRAIDQGVHPHTVARVLRANGVQNADELVEHSWREWAKASRECGKEPLKRARNELEATAEKVVESSTTSPHTYYRDKDGRYWRCSICEEVPDPAHRRHRLQRRLSSLGSATKTLPPLDEHSNGLTLTGNQQSSRWRRLAHALVVPTVADRQHQNRTWTSMSLSAARWPIRLQNSKKCKGRFRRFATCSGKPRTSKCNLSRNWT